MYEYINDRVAEVRQNIRRAANAAGRDEGEITLLAATKTQPAEAVRAVIAAGIDACGENRVQEMVQKLEASAYDGAPLHFIGHLQKNKLKQVVGKVSLIESVDSLPLLTMIDARARELGIVQEVLLEVNIGGEDSKSGVEPQTLEEILPLAGGFSGIKVRGLMTVPPICPNIADCVEYFSAMSKLFVDIKAKKYDNVVMDFLSMGMSADYEYSIAQGANIVRVGSGIFGPRDYSK